MLNDADKQWIAERLESGETGLLTEFHKWASPVELCVRSHMRPHSGAMDVEMESLAERVKKLEEQH